MRRLVCLCIQPCKHVVAHLAHSVRAGLRFAGPVFRGCGFRCAPCPRPFSPSGLRVWIQLRLHKRYVPAIFGVLLCQLAHSFLGDRPSAAAHFLRQARHVPAHLLRMVDQIVHLAAFHHARANVLCAQVLPEVPGAENHGRERAKEPFV